MNFLNWMKNDASKLTKLISNPDTIGKAAMALGGLAALAKHFKEKNDLKAITDDAVEEVMKRVASNGK